MLLNVLLFPIYKKVITHKSHEQRKLKEPTKMWGQGRNVQRKNSGDGMNDLMEEKQRWATRMVWGEEERISQKFKDYCRKRKGFGK